MNSKRHQNDLSDVCNEKNIFSTLSINASNVQTLRFEETLDTNVNIQVHWV